jgi:hypothetical protein
MKGEERKAALAAYKERKVAAGIYSVSCMPSGQVWVGSTPNLDAFRNRMLFELQRNAHRSPGLQQAWNEHGEAAFRVEDIERLDEEPDDYLRNAALKKQLAQWAAKLGASAL